MSALGDTLAALAQVLDSAQLGWYLFGAQAVAVRGAPRATLDVDITVAIPRDRVEALVHSLEAAGLVLRYPDQFDELLARGSVVPMIHESGMEVDMVVAGSGFEQLTLSRASRVDIEGTLIPVAQPTELAVMKVLAGRGKDLEDLCALIASGDVDAAEVRALLAQFEQALGQSGLVETFEHAITEVQGA